MGVGTGRPGIEDELRELGLPVVPPSERLAQVRETVTALRHLDGPGLHTPVVMAVRGPKAQALAADLANVVTVASVPDESRADVARVARNFRGILRPPAEHSQNRWPSGGEPAWRTERNSDPSKPAEQGGGQIVTLGLLAA